MTMYSPRDGSTDTFFRCLRLTAAGLSARAGARLFVAAAIPAAIVAILFASTALASISQRVALVIGNASYQHVPMLANPLNDAADIGTSLGRLGFTVTVMENAGRTELWNGLQEFALAASASEMAIVFYAGHGIEVDKRNFLVPVDARLMSDADIEFETVPLELVSRAVERARGFRLIILDACRDNPFTVAMQRAGATRSIGRGLAPVEPTGGMLVAYAAKEGTVAADGKGRNSPYTSALLAHLEEPGLEVNLLFRQVRDAVVAATGGRQVPFTYGSLSSQAIYLAALPEPEPEPAPAPATVQRVGDTEAPDANQIVERRIAAEKELLFWESVKDSTHAADFEAYLDQYSGGTYEILARNKLARLTDVPGGKSDVRVAIPDEPKPVSSPDPPAPTPEAVEASLGLQRGERRQIQLGLAALGFDPGPADGLFGLRTRTAIQEWQASAGEPVTGYLDLEIAKRLAEARNEAPPSGEQRGTLQQEEETSRAASAAPLKPFGPNWIVVENQRCQVYNPFPQPSETVTWTGACVDGKGSGHGRLVWRYGLGEDVYQGNLRAGKSAGYGTYVWPNGDRYEGEWQDSRPHGRGVSIRSDGTRHEGEFRDGKARGQGILTWPGDGQYEGMDGRYEGEWRDDKRHGTGTQTWPAGDRYKGTWRNDKRHGNGNQSWPNGSRYAGEWRDDKPHGHGTLVFANGKFHRGKWRDGCSKNPDGSWAFAATTKEACGFH